MTRVFLAALLLGGCTIVHVAPYERGYLARPDMAFDAGLGTGRAMEKIHPSKEAASGSASVGGGGCGCN